MVVALRACKRCGGDMSYEMDIFGHFRQCVQCSYLEDLPPTRGAQAFNSKGEQIAERLAVAIGTESIAKEAGHVI